MQSTPTDANEAKCLGCGKVGSKIVLPYVVPYEYHMRVFGERKIAQCTHCNLLQIHPVPDLDDLKRFYEEEYRAGGYNDTPFDYAMAIKRGTALAKLASRYLTYGGDGPNTLEIGAGSGSNLEGVRDRWSGASLFAIEMEEQSRSHLLRSGTSLLDSVVLEDAAVAASDNQFDLVLLSHVLEHWHAPMELIKAVSRLLAPAGICIIEVPNEVERDDSPLGGVHIVFFTTSTLKNFIEAAGGRVVFCEKCGPYTVLRSRTEEYDLEVYGDDEGRVAQAIRAVVTF